MENTVPRDVNLTRPIRIEQVNYVLIGIFDQDNKTSTLEFRLGFKRRRIQTQIKRLVYEIIKNAWVENDYLT